MDRLLIIQPCVPDYRLGLFATLHKRCRELIVASGPDVFSKMERDVSTGQPWSVHRSNTLLCGGRLVWYGSHAKWLHKGTVVIHGWDPRIISFWRDWLLCRLRGIPIIVWGHAWGRKGQKGLAFRYRHWLARRTDGVICYTESQAVLTRQLNPGLRVIAAPNACLAKEDCGVQGEEEERDAVIYVGRLVASKKVGLLLAGFARACQLEGGFKANLMIVGDGPERAELEERSLELGIADRVTWLGHQAEIPTLRKAYAKAFVSVSPGYVGLSLTQSFAFGVPALIAKDEPHSPEIEAAKAGISAEFFASDDPDSLAAKLVGAWMEWRGIAEKRKELAAWTMEHYSFEKMVERFVEIERLVVGHKTRDG